MNTSDQNRDLDSDRAFEALLEQTPPRPAPSVEGVESAREGLKTEWRRLTRRRQRRSWLISGAVAASLLAFILLGVRIGEAPIEPVRVATIEASTGPVHLVGDGSSVTSIGQRVELLAGQTILTASGSVAGLDWGNGGSLRIDENSRVRFVARNELELLSGRIYFDSGEVGEIRIVTSHGLVTHLGTRYMTMVDHDLLKVSVRSGRVVVDGEFHDGEAAGGQQLSVQGSARPTLLSISTWGPDWHWIEAAAPDFDADGETIYAFLLWVSRETGLTLRFSNDAVERVAREETFRGTVSAEPRAALRQQMATVDLAYVIDEDGVLTISAKGM